MIVRLFRPVGGAGPWLIYAPGGVQAAIEAPPALQQAMEGASGYFYAERPSDRDEWEIGERAPDQPW